MFVDYNIPDVGNLMLASFPLNSQFVKAISVDTPWYEVNTTDLENVIRKRNE